MKLQLLLAGVLFGLAQHAAGNPAKAAPKAQQTLTGCIDEQAGQYVLLDDRMVKIASLQSAGTDKEVFAKHLGRKVQVTGAEPSGRKGVFRVTRIEQVRGDAERPSDVPGAVTTRMPPASRLHGGWRCDSAGSAG
jgi:hypothetical protein